MRNADVLRAAADGLERLAARTTAGDWRISGLLASRPEVVAHRRDGRTEHVAEARAASAGWIAALSPTVAAPLSAWLRAEAGSPSPRPQPVLLARLLLRQLVDNATAENTDPVDQQTGVHRALLALRPGTDRRSPGAAVTLALCGDWEHSPPCPLAPHNTAVDGPDEALDVRVVFAAAPDDVAEVHRRIEAALAEGAADRPDGMLPRWRVREAGPDALRDEERALADRLAGRSPG